MEEEDLLEIALIFFSLSKDFTEEEFHSKYRDLAKKYHPDSGEYTSSILFNELIRSKEILDRYIHSKARSSHNSLNEFPSGQSSKSMGDSSFDGNSSNIPISTSPKDISYSIYKKAKEEENIAILDYFEKTKGNPVFLNLEDNPPLKKLIQDLSSPLSAYQTILAEYPSSIWANDAKDSIKRLGTWIGKNKSVGRT